MARVPIALELYSVREDLQKDVRGTLKKVAEMGYEGVEFAGYPPLPGEELKAILAETGLVCCSWHTPFDSVQPDKFDEWVALNKTVGNRSVIMPGLPGELTGSKANWLKAAKFMNELSAKLAAQGMFTGYHNHFTEFQPVDGGEWGWDILFENTDKSVVMQLDTGNALAGNAESVPLLKKYAGRARSVHLKPYSQKKAAAGGMEAGFEPLIGEDDIPWAEVFEAAETVGGTEWYIVEYECPAYPPLEAVDKCLQALKKMGK